MTHTPVLLHKVITGLEIKPNDIFFDGTVNGGGHAKAVYEILGAEGMIIGADLDGSALEKAKKVLTGGKARIFLKQENFRNLDKVLAEAKIEEADKILLDLGPSSNQFEESGRGFSFQKDEPLLMTFKNNPGPSDLTASDIVNKWDEENLDTIIKAYGEERASGKIAAAIVTARQNRPIETTGQLVKIIEQAAPRRGKIHSATKTFQALRITVNDEIGTLKEGLKKAFAHLKKGGRLGVISFHSIEDRTVKIFFKERAKQGAGRFITKKPITPSRQEILENPRSRSAKLRIIEKSK